MATTDPNLRKRALLNLLGFATAISIVHLGQGIGLILALGMPPLTGFALQAVVMEFVLALVVGLPLALWFKTPRGAWLFPTTAAVAFVVMERIVAVDPSKLGMWILPSVVAFLVFAGGRAVWNRKPALVLGSAIVTPAVLLLLPIVADSLREAEGAKTVAQGPAKPGAPDVLVIVMDTVRAQSVSAYGYPRDTTPNLDELAKEGLLFADANAPATWSLPAHAAIFTGTFPSWNNAHAETRFLDTRLPTMAEILVGQGYGSYAFSANPHISDSFGLTRGFQHNDKAWMAGTSGRNFSFIYRVVDAAGLGAVDDKGGQQVIGNIERWMRSRPKDDRPAFVFVNFLEAHFPFRQLPKPFRTAYQDADMNTLREIDQIAFGVQFGRQLTEEELTFVHQPLIDLYDGGVKYTDHLVGEVLRIYEAAGRLDDTLIVVLGDHGEMVGEQGAFGHVTPVGEPDLRVPLVMRYPKRIQPRIVEEPVSTVGVLATILDVIEGPPIPTQVASLLSDDPEHSGHHLGKPILAERFEEHMLSARFAPGTANGKGPLVNPRGRYRTYRSGPYKLVQHSTDGSFLYNLEEDPGESVNLAEAQPSTVQRLTDDLDDVLEQLGLPALDAPVEVREAKEMTEAERQALIELGYLEE